MNTLNTGFVIPAANQLPRLIVGETLNLQRHIERYGPLVVDSKHLIAHVAHAGLCGRGGAGFPTATKMEAVARKGRRPVIVANGTEGEPASTKDVTLMTYAPHLVLDGISAAAVALDATKAILCVDVNHESVASLLETAIAERRKAKIDNVAITVERSPNRYVAGEESALIHWLNGGEAKPTFTPPRPFERGVKNRPTLVDNVETLANIALIARYGSEWYRGLGDQGEPGSMLLTVTGAVTTPGVIEVASGTTIDAALVAAGGSLDTTQAVLTGGYFGTWISATTSRGLPITHADFAERRAALGCGVLFALPVGTCGLTETARVLRWLANENAGQCGPCMYGLPAMSNAFDALVAGGRNARNASAAIERMLPQIEGRGACKFPDGVVRFARTALTTFADDLAKHISGKACANQQAQLPTPVTGAWK
jgi:NADH:ubiquinone oxidoreductase subunit F (NADH-binding)